MTAARLDCWDDRRCIVTLIIILLQLLLQVPPAGGAGVQAAWADVHRNQARGPKTCGLPGAGARLLYTDLYCGV